MLADKVQASGVTISPGVIFRFSEVGTGQMAIGTNFILIDDTAPTPISDIFTGLPQGATFVVGVYTWRASYVGGTGNDFTVTIVAQP